VSWGICHDYQTNCNNRACGIPCRHTRAVATPAREIEANDGLSGGGIVGGIIGGAIVCEPTRPRTSGTIRTMQPRTTMTAMTRQANRDIPGIAETRQFPRRHGGRGNRAQHLQSDLAD